MVMHFSALFGIDWDGLNAGWERGFGDCRGVGGWSADYQSSELYLKAKLTVIHRVKEDGVVVFRVRHLSSGSSPCSNVMLN